MRALTDEQKALLQCSADIYVANGKRFREKLVALG